MSSKLPSYPLRTQFQIYRINNSKNRSGKTNNSDSQPNGCRVSNLVTQSCWPRDCRACSAQLWRSFLCQPLELQSSKLQRPVMPRPKGAQGEEYKESGLFENTKFITNVYIWIWRWDESELCKHMCERSWFFHGTVGDVVYVNIQGWHIWSSCFILFLAYSILHWKSTWSVGIWSGWVFEVWTCSSCQLKAQS